MGHLGSVATASQGKQVQPLLNIFISLVKLQVQILLGLPPKTRTVAEAVRNPALKHGNGGVTGPVTDNDLWLRMIHKFTILFHSRLYSRY